jgi:hypothetical protein
VHKIQDNKAFVFFEGASESKEVLVIDIAEKVLLESLQTTVSAQPIR